MHFFSSPHPLFHPLVILVLCQTVFSHYTRTVGPTSVRRPFQQVANPFFCRWQKCHLLSSQWLSECSILSLEQACVHRYTHTPNITSLEIYSLYLLHAWTDKLVQFPCQLIPSELPPHCPQITIGFIQQKFKSYRLSHPWYTKNSDMNSRLLCFKKNSHFCSQNNTLASMKEAC